VSDEGLRPTGTESMLDHLANTHDAVYGPVARNERLSEKRAVTPQGAENAVQVCSSMNWSWDTPLIPLIW